jgi:hypothetical protein
MAQKHREVAEKVFEHELGLISNQGIRQFVLDVFELFGHDGFFVRAASRSGRYHPFVNLNKIGVGGLVRHTKLVAYYASRFSRAFHGTGRGSDHPQGEDLGPFHDECVAAAILHDLMKDGDPDRKDEPARQGKDAWRLITGCHGIDLCEAIFKRMLRGQATESQTLILYGIACHMGVWTSDQRYNPFKLPFGDQRRVAELVHMADYAAAQKSDDVIAGLTGQGALDHYAKLVEGFEDPDDRANTKKAKEIAGV